MNRINFEKLPNFLLIGAPKCGTTSLHLVLGQHPEIYATSVKEVHFFDRELYSNGLEWYQEKYFNGADKFPARGESTPNYLSLSKIVAPRIKESFGVHGIKFISVFRDPVKRAYSHYWFRKRRLKEDESFEQALESEWQGKRNEWNSFIYGWGCYASLLQPFFELFPRENFQFILLEDIINNFSSTMSDLSRFLCVDEDFDFSPVRENQAYVLRNRRVNSFITDSKDPLHKVGKMFSRVFPKKQFEEIKNRIKKANLKEEQYPPIEKYLEDKLRDMYKGEIKELEVIMGRDLSFWYGK